MIVKNNFQILICGISYASYLLLLSLELRHRSAVPELCHEFSSLTLSLTMILRNLCLSYLSICLSYIRKLPIISELGPSSTIIQTNLEQAWWLLNFGHYNKELWLIISVLSVEKHIDSFWNNINESCHIYTLSGGKTVEKFPDELPSLSPRVTNSNVFLNSSM